MRYASILFVGLALLGASAPSPAPAEPTPAPSARRVQFERDVRPILKANCFHCHGEDEELAGGLDLRLRRMIVRGGDSGAAIEPGDHGQSLLFAYIEGGDMPPDEQQQLAPEEVQLIARWIDAGAPTLHPEPEATPVPGELLITAQERSHWAFQPIRKPAVPTEDPTAEANPIDAFIGRKLRERGLTPSAEADRLTLLRRAKFDLLGLPPTPQEVDEFLNDAAPDAYARLIDRLLESPHYGERWARHWLDVAGYADSEGYTNSDDIRKDAWAYRDYVIRAFNADKPWDEFLVEQLAGDELVQATAARSEQLANRDELTRERLTATGFLRMAPDGTGSNPADPEAARHHVITETIKIVSSSLLGMTVGCAECHHHRFDPIPQEDFYRLRAVLAPVFDTEQWKTPDARRVAVLSEEDRRKAEALEAQAKELDAAHDREKQAVLEIMLERVLAEVPQAERAAARAAFEAAKSERTAEQQKLVNDQFPMLGLLRTGTLHLFLARYEDGEELKKRYEDIQAQAAELRQQKPQPVYLRVATEVAGRVPETRVFERGDFTAPVGEPLAAGGLSVLQDPRARDGASAADHIPVDDPNLESSGRRLAYARYLTSGQHPLLARVLVNRFWMHHFGRGLVATPGEFGTRGTPPTHPELLDWLAADFMEHGWRLKRLHRLIMTSATYRQSSVRRPEADAIDSDNRLLWRMPVRRLEAEMVRDAILAVSGRLNRQLFGAPIPVDVDAGGVVTVAGGTVSEDARELRRSIYVQVRRSQPVAMLEAFDAPQMEPNCERRVSSTVSTQSLALLNSAFVIAEASAFADRILSQQQDGQKADDLREYSETAWRLAFGVAPDELTAARLSDYLKDQLETFRQAEVKEPEREALASLCQVLFGSNRFLYVD